MLTELWRLTRSWSVLNCSAWASCPFRRTRCELPLRVLPLDDAGEEFEIMVFEDCDSLQFDPEVDVGISVESWEFSVWEPSPSDLLDNKGLTDESPDARLLLLTVRTLLPWFTLLPRVRLLLRSISITSIEAGKTALGMAIGFWPGLVAAGAVGGILGTGGAAAPIVATACFVGAVGVGGFAGYMDPNDSLDKQLEIRNQRIQQDICILEDYNQAEYCKAVTLTTTHF